MTDTQTAFQDAGDRTDPRVPLVPDTTDLLTAGHHGGSPHAY
jgi:hypothetical protein